MASQLPPKQVNGLGRHTAEQQLLLTRKVTGIMQGVLLSEMDKDAKMMLSVSISEMLQLLLQE